MYDILQKIGIPATIAAVVSTVVVIIPFIFKLDERYAKEDDLQAQVRKLEDQNKDLQKELAELSGFQTAMIAWLQTRPAAVPAPVEHAQVPPRRVFAPRPVLPGDVASAPSVTKPKPDVKNLGEIMRGLEAQQKRLAE